MLCYAQKSMCNTGRLQSWKRLLIANVCLSVCPFICLKSCFISTIVSINQPSLIHFLSSRISINCTRYARDVGLKNCLITTAKEWAKYFEIIKEGSKSRMYTNYLKIVKLSSKPKTENQKQEIRKRAYTSIQIRRHHPPQLFKTDK